MNMTWYAASIVMAIRPKSGYLPGGISVHENVVLFEAGSPEAAAGKATQYAKAEQGAHDDLMVNDEPAEMLFVGIRKLVNISNPHPASLDDDPPRERTEVTYSEFELKDETELKKLVAGQDVTVTYVA